MAFDVPRVNPANLPVSFNHNATTTVTMPVATWTVMPCRPGTGMKPEREMKIMAVGTLPAPLSTEQVDHFMPSEVPATLQLYLDGKMEQFWRRDDGKGVVFLMATGSVDEARQLLGDLPLVSGGLLHFELYPLSPLSPLGRLIKTDPPGVV
jgi:muconolactone delta-isomerase